MAAKKKASGEPRKKRESVVPTDETKRAKFIRLATARVGKAVKAIAGIGNLSGSAYEYSEADIAKIKGAIMDANVSMLARFQPKQKKEAGPAVVFE